jgi:hypothetical protein
MDKNANYELVKKLTKYHTRLSNSSGNKKVYQYNKLSNNKK